MQTMLPKLTDYWDYSSTTRAVDGLATRLASLSEEEKKAALMESGAAVQEHVRVFPDKLLATAAVAVADDLYKAACWIDRWDSDLEAYLKATAAAFWASFSARGLTLHYLVDNVFEDLSRPLALFLEWFRSCGIVCVCPQAIAARVQFGGAKETRRDIAQRMPTYMREARDVAETILDRCRAESRHFFLLDLDYEEHSFRSSLAETNQDGLLTVFRNQAADPGTTVWRGCPPAFAETRDQADSSVARPASTNLR